MIPAVAGQGVDGMAGPYPCDKTDLVYEAVIYRRDIQDKLMILFTRPKAEAGKAAQKKTSGAQSGFPFQFHKFIPDGPKDIITVVWDENGGGMRMGIMN